LAKATRKPFADQPPKDIGCAARREADDDADRPARIGLRRGTTRKGGQHGSASRQTKEISTDQGALTHGFLLGSALW
jgi:hypothetical protein